MRCPSAALPLCRSAGSRASPGRCLDGTPAIYYHAKGTGSGANKWFIHQQGGGWCYTEESCVGRSKMSLGSTKADPKTRTLNGGYMAWDNVSNPLMYNWVRAAAPRFSCPSTAIGLLLPPFCLNSTSCCRTR